jgi:hypothetical protein
MDFRITICGPGVQELIRNVVQSGHSFIHHHIQFIHNLADLLGRMHIVTVMEQMFGLVLVQALRFGEVKSESDTADVDAWIFWFQLRFF